MSRAGFGWYLSDARSYPHAQFAGAVNTAIVNARGRASGRRGECQNYQECISHQNTCPPRAALPDVQAVVPGSVLLAIEIAEGPFTEQAFAIVAELVKV